MPEFPDQPLDHFSLNKELARLDLPDFTGSSRLSRRDGEAVDPYVVIKCGELSQGQRASVKAVLAAHKIPEPKPPEPSLEDRIAALEARGGS